MKWMKLTSGTLLEKRVPKRFLELFKGSFWNHPHLKNLFRFYLHHKWFLLERKKVLNGKMVLFRTPLLVKNGSSSPIHPATILPFRIKKNRAKQFSLQKEKIQ